MVAALLQDVLQWARQLPRNELQEQLRQKRVHPQDELRVPLGALQIAQQKIVFAQQLVLLISGL